MALILEELHRRSGRRVAVLVDEYDKPILDALDEPEMLRENRDFLRGLYGCLKFADRHLRFVFLTGVSKFSKLSLFSGLNNLRDITVNPVYSSVCGFTEADLDRVFALELEGLYRSEVLRLRVASRMGFAACLPVCGRGAERVGAGRRVAGRRGPGLGEPGGLLAGVRV